MLLLYIEYKSARGRCVLFILFESVKRWGTFFGFLRFFLFFCGDLFYGSHRGDLFITSKSQKIKRKTEIGEEVIIYKQNLKFRKIY